MDKKLELYAIIELFGHQKMAGKVTEQTVGSSTFIRVDVPKTSTQPEFTRIINPNAIYALNPVTEEVCIALACQFESKPIQTWDIRQVIEKLPALKERNGEFDFDNE